MVIVLLGFHLTKGFKFLTTLRFFMIEKLREFEALAKRSREVCGGNHGNCYMCQSKDNRLIDPYSNRIKSVAADAKPCSLGLEFSSEMMKYFSGRNGTSYNVLKVAAGALRESSLKSDPEGVGISFSAIYKELQRLNNRDVLRIIH